MEKKKSIKLNYIYNVSYQLLTLLAPLITTPYISRVLGADLIGDYSFTASIVTYFTMVAALGTLTYGNREISYLQDDKRKRSTSFWEIEFLSIFSTLLCTVAYLIFLAFFSTEHHALYTIQILSLLAIAFDITWLLQGMEEFGKITLRNTIFKLLQLLFIFTMVNDNNDLLIYVIGMVFIPLVSNLSLWFYLPKFVEKPVLSELHPLRHLKPTFALFIPTVAISIYTVFDKTMIGFFASNFENGYYEQAQKISKATLVIVTSLGAVMIPRIGYYFNQGNTKKVKEFLYQSYNFVWFLGLPICFGLIGISANLVPWFYGAGYDKISQLLPVLGLLVPLIGISNVTGIQYLVTTKRENLLTRTVMIGAVINFLCNLILIPRLYSVGASIASVIAEASITLTQLYLIRKELSISKIMKQSIKYLLASIVILFVLLLESHYLSASILHTALMIGSGGVIYLLLLFLLRDAFLLEGIHSILHPSKG